MKKTIIILANYLNNEFSYASFIHSHAKGYVDKGYNVIVLVPRSTYPFLNLLKKTIIKNLDGVKIIIGYRLSISGLFPNCPININGIFYYLSIKKIIKKLIKDEDIMFFDAHTFHCEGYAAYLLKRKYKNIKTTITFHGSDLEAVMLSKIQRKRAIKISKYINSYVCVSDKLTNKLKSLNIQNVKTIYNGINNFKIHNYKKEKVFISCGSLIESKNFDLLLDAFYLFNKENENYKLKIIGSGYLENRLIMKIKNLELEEKVFLLGEMSNERVYEEYERAEIFLLVSSPEGFGIVYPEAMYCGCVTIGTKNEGIDGFIIDGKNGFLVNPDAIEIVNKIKYIISNDCEKIRKNGILDAKELTWSKNCDKYLELK